MGKRIIITGGSSGLGLEISKLFLSKGFEVICLSREKPKIKVNHIPTDLSSEKSIEEAISTIREKFPEFNILVNCAGIIVLKPYGTVTLKENEKVMRINVLSHMRLVSGLLDLIKKNNTDIVNIGSTVSFKAYEDQEGYVASKWATRGFTEVLRLQLKNTDCRIIGFHPGGMKTSLFERAGSKINLDPYMEPGHIALLLFEILAMPKNIEVSEIIINRKPSQKTKSQNK